jgi:hypothetical protein
MPPPGIGWSQVRHCVRPGIRVTQPPPGGPGLGAITRTPLDDPGLSPDTLLGPWLVFPPTEGALRF